VKRLWTAGVMSLAAFGAVGFTTFVADERIEKRVDSRIRAEVAAIADSLEREGVTAELLIQYSLEGTLKGANPQVILTGVRKWASDLRRSRRLLGPNATDAELSAGAQAIRAGVNQQQLERFREARKEIRLASAVSAMSTMVHLIKQGVPPDTASTVLVNITLASASEAEIGALQDEIERDIKGGMPAGLSTVGRAVGLLAAISAERDSTDGVVPGTALPSTRGTARPADPMATGGLGRSAVGQKADAARPPAPRGKDNKRPP
jgi:hypothetical protein